MPTTFWLSFADPTKPKGSQFIGVCIIEAPTFEDAVTKSWRLGINPGSEVSGVEIPSHILPIYDRSEFHRLLTPDEARAIASRPALEEPRDPEGSK